MLGEDHPLIASQLYNLASLCSSMGRRDEAESQFRRALDIWERTLGKSHPQVSRCLIGLAVLCKRRGRFAEAEQLYRRALAIAVKVRGTDHPDCAVILGNLAEPRALYYVGIVNLLFLLVPSVTLLVLIARVAQ